MDKDTPPLSPEVKDEDMIPVEEVDEIVDELLDEARYSDDSADSISMNENDSDNPMEDSMEEEASQRDDALYVFRGHSSSKKLLGIGN